MSYSLRDKNLRLLGFSSYKEYLKSQLWKNIKIRLREIAGDNCVCCGKTSQAIHHESYDLEDLNGDRFVIYAITR